MLNAIARVVAIPFVALALSVPTGAATMTAYDFDFTAINGDPMPLSDLEGKALLVVNTASFCGYTPQYRALEELWQEYKDQGLVLVGVPSDSFNQEYDDNAEIKEFCDTNYSITFPLTESTPVKGDSAHPFYAWVKEQGGRSAEPSWNFNKVLVDANGNYVKTFGSGVAPDAGMVRRAVDAALPGAE